MTTEKCDHGLSLNETCLKCEELQLKIFKVLFGLLIAVGIVLLCFEYLSKAHAEHWDPKIQRLADLGDEDAIQRLHFFQAAGWLPADPVHGYNNAYKANCCGQADAYEADNWHIDKSDCGFNPDDPDECGIIAELTCNEPQDCEAIPGKRPIAAGTMIKIPHEKIMVPGKPINNTGHGWVFLSTSGTYIVFCYSRPSGL